MDLFANTSVPSLHIALNGLGEREASVGQNLANVSVPGYKANHTTFENDLQQALNYQRTKTASLVTTNPKHMQVGVKILDEVKVETEPDLMKEIHTGGNNVDIDAEMLNLARTGLQYRAITQISRRQLDQLRSVIRGGS